MPIEDLTLFSAGFIGCRRKTGEAVVLDSNLLLILNIYEILRNARHDGSGWISTARSFCA